MSTISKNIIFKNCLNRMISEYINDYITNNPDEIDIDKDELACIIAGSFVNYMEGIDFDEMFIDRIEFNETLIERSKRFKFLVRYGDDIISDLLDKSETNKTVSMENPTNQQLKTFSEVNEILEIINSLRMNDRLLSNYKMLRLKYFKSYYKIDLKLELEELITVKVELLKQGDTNQFKMYLQVKCPTCFSFHCGFNKPINDLNYESVNKFLNGKHKITRNWKNVKPETQQTINDLISTIKSFEGGVIDSLMIEHKRKEDDDYLIIHVNYKDFYMVQFEIQEIENNYKLNSDIFFLNSDKFNETKGLCLSTD